MTNGEKYIRDEVNLSNFVNELGDYIANSGRKIEDKTDIKAETWYFLTEEAKIKQILSEDERVILRNIKNAEFGKVIGREEDFSTMGGKLYLKGNNVCQKAFAISTLYNHLFRFIKNGEEYNIQELLGDEE